MILTYEQLDGSVTPFAIIEVYRSSPDVASALNESNYRRSGWQANFPCDLIPDRATKIIVWAFDTDNGKAYKITSVPLESP